MLAEYMMFEGDSFDWLETVLPVLAEGFASLPPGPTPPLDQAAMVEVLRETAIRLRENYPYFHPLYAGQMLKPPHPIARAAYALAMRINPNNHALDGGRASSQMEIEAVRALAAMFAWTAHLGHLTSGGTFANLEALWVAGQLHPDQTILASDQAHYTHQRISGVLQLPFASVASDARGRMCLDALEARLQQGNVGTVVVTLGTTALGAIDSLPEILALRDQYGFRVHVDAAYGGYFTLVSNLDAESVAAYAALPAADSIVIDPHKHGLQPYGCGCILFRDPSVGRFYKHDSPYTYFSSDELHLGEITLECSRAGAAAVALWATQRALPLTRGGEFAGMLESCRSAALEFYRRLCVSSLFIAPIRPQLDIVVWAIPGATVEESSNRARAVFDAAARRDLHLALVHLPRRFFASDTWPGSNRTSHDSAQVTCLRSVLMKPEHLAWIDQIWERLEAASQEVVMR
ncbi:MAG: aminotransferase class I/II-fold pyridoxal phosphate-dependent enzyme [Terriglobia bacterium]|nr:aminotransferase class I/II-fold pyridoxal phosphate-dependent enzyme [Terriglobia bacterium]